jgi:hypothetical protein
MSFADKIKQINDNFNNGIVPNEFMPTTKSTLLDDVIDDVKFVAFYKEYKINSLFPFADSIPGFKEAVVDKLIEEVKDMTLTDILESKRNIINE